MDISELIRDQLIELKERYMIELSNEGTYAEVMQVDHDEPGMIEIATADTLISDEVIFEHYAGICFTEDDFFCTAA